MDLRKQLNILGAGEPTFQPYFVLEDGKECVPEYGVSINEASNTIHLSVEWQKQFRDNLYITYGNGAFICKRTFQNISDQPLKIKELAIELNGITYGLDPCDDYYYHVENPKIYSCMTLPVDFKQTPLEDVDDSFEIPVDPTILKKIHPLLIDERIGVCFDQPFPAVLLSNYRTKKGLVFGTLSQDVFYHNYHVKHVDDKVRFRAFSSFMDIACLQMEPGRVLTDEWYLGKTDEADDIEKIFAGYTEVLRKKLPSGYGRTNVNRDNMVWGSWNDGIRRNVNEELVLTEAKFLKENFPTVQWIQLDDGYAVYNKIAFGLGVPYEGEAGVDKEKFPHGLRYLSDKIREIGLRPALWIGGLCPKETLIYKEHPEWFIDFSICVNDQSPLDVSKPEVRKYMCEAIQVLCKQYGFEGIKHDFWSYAFEHKQNLYTNCDKSGYEYRTWWMKELRNVIAKDGHLQTGCDIAMGNPFLGEYFTNYRYGIDVGNGDWNNVKTNFLWGTACFATHTGDLFVPNSDSVGLLSGLNDNEAMFNINYCLVTHSMVEIAGRLSQSNNHERLRILKKAVCNPNNGQDIYFVGFDYRNQEKNTVPNIIYFKTPHFSKIEESRYMPLRTVGIFNIKDEDQKYRFSVADLTLPAGEYILTDVWSGEQYELNESFELKLAPHASRLLAVSLKSGVQLFDANIRINSVKVIGNKMLLETDYKFNGAELTLSDKVLEARFDGEKINFEKNAEKVCLDIPGKGTLELTLEM